jgi:acetyl-CoA carboxylase biotin carboxyl carrier protein
VSPDSLGLDGAWRRRVSDLITVLEGTDLSELVVEHGPFSLRIERQLPDVTAAIQASAVSVAAPEEIIPIPMVLRSPQVGTFYVSAEPKGEPFLHIGDTVEQGQVIGLIEAMKLISEVEAESTGVVRRVLVEDGHPVEYGQPLFELE